MKTFSNILFTLLLCCISLLSFGSTKDIKTITYSGTNTPENPCKLDIYSAQKSTSTNTALIWFHGGGLTSGSKNNPVDEAFAKFWQAKGVTLINVDYRLSPGATFPAYIQDAAAAVSWTLKNASKLNIDAHKIYIGGHSAGAYLTSMLALAPEYLRQNNIEPSSLAGFISLSGQMTTHFTVRKERGLSDLPVIVDDAAPAYYVSTQTPRLLLLIGDNDWPARLEENQLIYAHFAKLAKNENVDFHILENRNHNSIYEKIPEPGDKTYALIADFMKLKAEKDK